MDPAILADVRVIVSHDECSDGTASAMLLHDALPGAAIEFADYGRAAAKLVARPGMLFCDFSPPEKRVDEFVAAGAIVLDHHRSARPIVERFGARGSFGDETTDPGVSGAMLAFRHVWLPLRGDVPERGFVEWFAAVAGARDTWQTASPRWHDGCVQHRLLTAMTRAFWLATPLTALARDWTERYAWVGEQLWARDLELLDRAIATGHRFTTSRGLRAIALEGLEFTSDAAERIGSDVDIVIAFGFIDTADRSVMRLSLRSHTDFDCARFAERFGGGGHTRAAGFGLPLGDPHPFHLIERLFDDATLG